MQIEANTKDLNSALSAIKFAYSSRSTVPILSCCVLTATTSGCTVRVTDLDTHALRNFDGYYVEPGVVLTDYKKLCVLLKTVTTSVVTLSTVSTVKKIKGLEDGITTVLQVGNATLPTFDRTQYPEIPDRAYVSSVSVNSGSFAEKLTSCLTACVEQDRYSATLALSCVRLRQAKNTTLSCATTDTHKICEAMLPAAFTDWSEDVYVPCKQLVTAVKSCKGLGVLRVDIAPMTTDRPSLMRITHDRGYVTLRLPCIEPLGTDLSGLTWGYDATFPLDVKEFIRQCTLARVFSTLLKVFLEHGTLKIKSEDASLGDYQGRMSVETDRRTTCLLDIDQVLAYLKTEQNKVVLFSVSSKVIAFSPVDDPDTKYILAAWHPIEKAA